MEYIHKINKFIITQNMNRQWIVNDGNDTQTAYNHGKHVHYLRNVTAARCISIPFTFIIKR